jgi:hypothetical protein
MTTPGFARAPDVPARAQYPWGVMRRILLSCAILGVLALSASAASAGSRAAAKPGYLVVRNAAGDGRIDGPPVVTLAVHGFVLGKVKGENQARVDIIQLGARGNQGAPTAAGPDRASAIRWNGLPGHRFNGSGFRFRAPGGYYRVVVRGSGVYLFAGGSGSVKLHGSSLTPTADGRYSIDGGAFRSLPKRVVKRRIGRG